MGMKNSAWGFFSLVCFGGIFLGFYVLLDPTAIRSLHQLAQQKLCDEQARNKFREDKHSTSTYSSYTSHYDPTVNVCYIRVNSTSTETFPVVVDMVYDAFGGRVYANYEWIDSQNKKYREGSPSTCELDIPGKPVEKCKSLEQFDVLTEKYFGVTR
jgi:hypothetical protein